MIMMQERTSLSKAGIVCCSNGLTEDITGELTAILQTVGITPVFSPCLYGAGARERAESLMQFYHDTEIDAIFDISGGDIANEILPYLDYSAIKGKQLWGYSDLTVLLNAIYTMTGNSGVLYQMRYFRPEKRKDLFHFSYHFIQGEALSGIVVGGNIRCFLKLAGTKYFPDMHGKILLLEARSGMQPQMIAYLSQLQQIGVFEQINGILLGTFTELEHKGQYGQMEQLVQRFAGKRVPIAKTNDIGHGKDAKAIVIGEKIPQPVW